MIVKTELFMPRYTFYKKPTLFTIIKPLLCGNKQSFCRIKHDPARAAFGVVAATESQEQGLQPHTITLIQSPVSTQTRINICCPLQSRNNIIGAYQGLYRFIKENFQDNSRKFPRTKSWFSRTHTQLLNKIFICNALKPKTNMSSKARRIYKH